MREYRKRPGRRKRCTQLAKESRDRKKSKVYDFYGRKCKCCGETNIGFLTIDHINGGGNKQRKLTGYNSGDFIVNYIVRNNFPPEFQTLCMNCNWGRRNTGICPHKVST